MLINQENNYLLIKILVLFIGFVILAIGNLIICKKQYKLSGLGIVLTTVSFIFLCVTYIKIL